MNMPKTLFSAALFILCLGLAGVSFAQDTHAPSLTTDPSSAPANQEFAAFLNFETNPGSAGFWGEPRPTHVIDGNVITFAFDTGCGWICPPGVPTYRAFPFTMPALPAGTYVVRFAESLYPPIAPSSIIAEFTVDVGLGGGEVSTPLPLGGSASVLLGLLILMLGWKRLYARGDLRKVGA